MAIIVVSVVGFFAIVAFVAYLRKRHYHAPNLGTTGSDESK
jgi:hypothetical protein